MKKYRVSAEVTISIFTDVMATSKKEALELAKERGLSQISDDGFPEREWTTSGELDGEPKNLTIDKE